MLGEKKNTAELGSRAFNITNCHLLQKSLLQWSDKRLVDFWGLPKVFITWYLTALASVLLTDICFINHLMW